MCESAWLAHKCRMGSLGEGRVPDPDSNKHYNENKYGPNHSFFFFLLLPLSHFIFSSSDELGMRHPCLTPPPPPPPPRFFFFSFLPLLVTSSSAPLSLSRSPPPPPPPCPRTQFLLGTYYPKHLLQCCVESDVLATISVRKETNSLRQRSDSWFKR